MNHHVEYIEQKYTLAVIGDVIALLGFMIYLEIIQLNFCGLNDNLRNSIMIRSDDDYANKKENEIPMNEINNKEYDDD